MCNGNMHVSGTCAHVSAPGRLFHKNDLLCHSPCNATKYSLLYHCSMPIILSTVRVYLAKRTSHLKVFSTNRNAWIRKLFFVPTDRQDRQDRQTDRQTDRQDRQTDRQTDRQDRQTDRQTDKTDRQTDKTDRQ